MHERIRDEFTPQLLESFKNVGEPSRIPVVVVGMPRSGTTLIEQILSSHPDVFGAGELDYLTKPLSRAISSPTMRTSSVSTFFHSGQVGRARQAQDTIDVRRVMEALRPSLSRKT